MSLSESSCQDREFAGLGLAEPLVRAITDLGYTAPTPIQAEIIPHIIEGRDVIGQAQTGTGKTAAFALPLLHRLNCTSKAVVQVLVLTPTRELAIQVAESFGDYGKHLPQLRIAAIYGGQEYGGQLRQLDRGVHVVVGTPGRIMDHIRRGSLRLANLQALVLDEADEMLKMGFFDDVEWILQQIPEERQTTLFSATMPDVIRRVAKKALKNPAQVTITTSNATAPDIEQRYLVTRSFAEKQEALERILEVEPFEAALIFVRTKVQTLEIAERLVRLGYKCGALNGDIAQNVRQRMIEQLKTAKLDILVATDVAARGLDVERISHVINFDAPFDNDSYVHRIGRTGRAGRSGKAILFLAGREKRMVASLARAVSMPMQEMQMPSPAEINATRIESFKQKISDNLRTDCSPYVELISQFCNDFGHSPEAVAAALAKIVQGDTFLLPEERVKRGASPRTAEKKEKTRQSLKGRAEQKAHAIPARPGKKSSRGAAEMEFGMERYRIQVGENDGVKPANIVGAIANEADIASEHIGRISIFADHSLVDLPEGMPRQILRILQKARINGKMMAILRDESSAGASPRTESQGTGTARRQAKPGRKTEKPSFRAKAAVSKRKYKNSAPAEKRPV